VLSCTDRIFAGADRAESIDRHDRDADDFPCLAGLANLVDALYQRCDCRLAYTRASDSGGESRPDQLGLLDGAAADVSMGQARTGCSLHPAANDLAVRYSPPAGCSDGSAGTGAVEGGVPGAGAAVDVGSGGIRSTSGLNVTAGSFPCNIAGPITSRP